MSLDLQIMHFSAEPSRPPTPRAHQSDHYVMVLEAGIAVDLLPNSTLGIRSKTQLNSRSRKSRREVELICIFLSIKKVSLSYLRQSWLGTLCTFVMAAKFSVHLLHKYEKHLNV